MSTIITRNSATSGSIPASLVQGELAINVTDNRLFFGSGSGNIVKEFGVTASYATNALSASFATTASYVSSNFQYEIHVSQIDGNDTTGNGDLLKPVATIGKALLIVSASVASTDRRTIIVHPGTYIENITVDTTNTYFFSTGLLGANCLISGSVTVSAATRMSGLKMTNLIVSSSAPVYINNCAVDNQMTVSGSGYLEVQNTSLQCTSGIQVVGPASSGVIFDNCLLYPLTVNNASAAVYVISCNQAITPTLTAGALTITRSTISSLTSGATSTALTTAAGSVLVLESCNVYNSLLTSHAAITANGFYSIKNVIYNRSASTLASLSGTGGPLATVSQFQYINADNINSTQGLTVTGSINVSGSVINNLTASYAISASQALSASFSTTASYATQALSASYAPAGNPFPYNGNAQISGSLDVTGSFTNIGPAQFSGSFIVQGDLIPGSPPFIPNIGPYDAIKVNDIAGQRLLYGTPNQGASASIDFGNRTLYTSNGTDALSWSGQSGTYETFLYNQQYITETSRGNLFGYNSYGGQILGDSYFNIAVTDNDLVYLNTDGQWYQVDQTTNTSTKMLGIAKNIFSQTGSVVIEGDIVVTTATGYPAVANAGYGLPVYIKQGVGTAMDTANPVSGYVRLLGHCYWNSGGGGTEWIMKFRPSHEWIEL